MALTDEPLKIVHVLHSFDVGGLENGVVNLINHLDHQFYRHIICCITHSGNMAKRLERYDVQIVEFEKKKGHDWFLVFRLARLFWMLKPHIVHTRNWGTIDAIIAAWLSRVPIRLHGEHGWKKEDLHDKSMKKQLAWRVLSLLVNQFVAVSMQLAEWLMHDIGINKKKVTIITNGVDLKKFDGLAEKKAIRQKLGLSADKFVIGSVGRLDPVKDYVSLVRAFWNSMEKCPNAHLILVGNGPCWEEINNLKGILGLQDQISILGERDDVAGLLCAMDVFVLPSLFEGISNTILEAMAVGLPVIATRVGGNSELVDHGKTGLLVSPQNICALEEAINTYFSNPELCTQHGAAGKKKIERELSLAKMVQSYHVLYSGLVGDRFLVPR